MCLKTLPDKLHPWYVLVGCSTMTIWVPHISPCWSGSPVFISFHSDLQHGEVLQPYTSPRFICAWSKYSFPPLKHTPPFIRTLERGQVFLWAKLSLLLGYSKVRRQSLTKPKSLCNKRSSALRQEQKTLKSWAQADDRMRHRASLSEYWLTDTNVSLESLLLTLKRRGQSCASPVPVSSVDIHYLTSICLSCIFIPPFLKAGSSELTLNA